MVAPSHNFEEALDALARPLRFAARNDFASLRRIKDLESTLEQAAERVLTQTQQGDDHDFIVRFLAALPSPNATLEKRIVGLQRCLALLEERQGSAPKAGESPRASSQQPLSPPSPSLRRYGVQPVALREDREIREKGRESRSPPRQKRDPPDALPVADEQPPQRGKASGESGAQDATKEQGLTLEHSLQYLKGVGPRLAEALAGRDLRTVGELLLFLPRDYESRQDAQSIAQLSEGEQVRVEGRVLLKSTPRLRGRRQLEVVLDDGQARLSLRWFRVPGRGFTDRFAKGVRVSASGVVKRYRGKLQIVHPETTILAGDAEAQSLLCAGGQSPQGVEGQRELIPRYLEVEGMRPPQLRRIIEQVLPAAPQLEEPIPEFLRGAHQLPSLGQSVAALHAPPEEVSVAQLRAWRTPWQRRLIYEELLLLQLAVLRRRAETVQEQGRALPGLDLLATAEDLLPFAPTGAQARVLRELQEDLGAPRPMHRLLQGDVGSGKTAVALSAAASVVAAGHQVALMVPTEVLAEQHARTALKILSPAGIRVGFLSGSLPAAEKRRHLGPTRFGAHPCGARNPCSHSRGSAL